MTRVKKKEQTSPDKRQLSLKGQNRWFAGALANIEKPKYAILIVTALSFATRLYYIHEPAHICWDETHFGKMASWYINRTFFFDVHPPLGKMLIALSGHLTGYDGRFAFDKPGDRATLSMTKSHQSAIIAGLLVVFDNGMITLTRYILLDPPLLFFIAASVLSLAEFSFNIGPRCDGRETFSWRWWFWLVCTGVSIACAFSIKFVGLFIVTQIGLRTIYDIWVILGDTKESITYFIKHFAARTLCLILLPICLYVTFFWFHINQLNHSGNGDGFYSSAFQSQLIGNSLYNSSSPAHLAYGAEITIKNNRIGGAYLHSHWHLYPEGIGARQQQVTTYSHKDSNNNWLIKRGIADQRPEDVFVRDGDLVVLEHKITRRNLHSHFEAAPLTKRHYQVTCYGESGLGDANDVWQIQKESSSISTEDDRIYTVKSKFKLVHYLTNCALHSHSKQLPKWAYEQMEVTCNPKLFDRNNLWNIEDNYYPNLPNVSFQEYAPSFIDKFIESHAVMLQGNAGLKPKEGEVTSRPWQWPLNYKGQFFSASKGHKIYLLGNPVIWWTNLAVIPVSILMIISLTIIERIKHSKNNQTANLKDRMASTSGIEHNYLGAGIWTLMGWALHYVPFYFMGRVLYFHHYFPAFLFSCMLTAMTFDYLMTILCIKLKTCLKIDLSVIRCEVAFILVAVIVHTFARFVPLTYGSKIDSTSEESAAGNTTTESWRNEQHLSSLKWLDSWEF